MKFYGIGSGGHGSLDPGRFIHACSGLGGYPAAIQKRFNRPVEKLVSLGAE
ncbi:MAG: hypothetical protein OXN84_07100 [Albidovulum sp.]|nr:hypothetical protein [Albidovulum sp.]